MMRLFGPIPPTAIHMVVDMQELFRSHPDWGSAALSAIIPPIRRLLAARPQNAYFSRFITPHESGHATGVWQRYYRRWEGVTLARMDAGLLDIVEELKPWAHRLVDKAGYSALGNPEFRQRVGAGPDHCLILTGVETDVCVLATVMEAMDLGLRVILAVDAVSSSSAGCHDSALQILHERFDEQVELAPVDDIIAAWRHEAVA